MRQPTSPLREILPIGGLFAFALILVGTVGLVSEACTPQNAKTAEAVAVRVADNLCVEEAKQPDAPEWIALVCTAESVTSHVLLPRADWRAMRARAAGRVPPEAGPGK